MDTRKEKKLEKKRNLKRNFKKTTKRENTLVVFVHFKPIGNRANQNNFLKAL